jgi:hypothetical protein
MILTSTLQHRTWKHRKSKLGEEKKEDAEWEERTEYNRPKEEKTNENKPSGL